MEKTDENKQIYKLTYHGKGLDYFVIMVVNAILNSCLL
jgi:uncharacterized membrane protein YjgN (DUF898 family)